MSSFKGLYLKDLKISAATFFIGLVLLNVLTILSLGLKEYFDEPLIPAILFFIAVVAHVFYLPGMLFSSLQIEGQSQLWLHNPNRGAKLFLSKITAGMTFYMISILVTMLLSRLSLSGLSVSNDYQGFSEMVRENLLIMGAGITLTSIYLSVWVLFYWSLYHSLKRIPIVNQIRWLVILFVWIVLSTIGSMIQNTSMMRVINEKGTFSVSIFDATVGQGSFSTEMAHINFATIGQYILITIIVFLVSVWLLERKVEV